MTYLSKKLKSRSMNYQKLARPPLKVGSERIDNFYNKYPKKVEDISGIDKWEGKRCFIIGGGESLKGFDFSKLSNELTIGINRSFEFLDSTIIYSMDTRFYGWLKHKTLDNYTGNDVLRKWQAFKGFKVFLSPLNEAAFDPDIYLVKRLLKKTISFDVSCGIFAGNNSGLGALLLATALGANPIYLLGYDMKISGSTHWHSGYPNQTIQGQSKVLDSYKKMFEDFAPKLKSLGVDVVNLNNDSGLRCFPFKDFNEVLLEEDRAKEKSKDRSNESNFIVVSYYTRNTGYEQEAEKLIASLNKLFLKYHVEVIDSLGSWQKNTQYKAILLRKLLDKYPDKNLLYVDCDAIFYSYPDIIESITNADIAAHRVDWGLYRSRNVWQELLNGTLYLKNNEVVRKVVDHWIIQNSKKTNVFEQRNLQEVLAWWKDKINFYNLPATYCKIFDSMKIVQNPVIEHYQASRTLKNKV